MSGGESVCLYLRLSHHFAMPTDPIAYQQMAAAWVSAGAAVLQAVGALAAIGVSIKLARDSARREISTAEAARRRIEEADRAATERAEREIAAAHNAPILKAITLIELAAQDAQNVYSHAIDKYGSSSFRGTIVGALTGAHVTMLMDAMIDLKMAMPDQESVKVLANLEGSLDLRQAVSRQSGEYVAYLETQLTSLRSAADALRALLR